MKWKAQLLELECRNINIFCSLIANPHLMWLSEVRVKLLYRSMTTRSTLKLVHHLEPEPSSYMGQMAWFCLDGEERVQDAGWKCRTMYHANRLPQNIFRVTATRHDVEPLLNLGDPDAMREVTNLCGNEVVTLNETNTNCHNFWIGQLIQTRSLSRYQPKHRYM